MSILTTTQEAVMNKSVPAQRPTVVLRSHRNLRSLVAVLLVAIAALSATVAVIAIDGDGTTTSPVSVANGRSYPTLNDPFQSQTSSPARSPARTRPPSRPRSPSPEAAPTRR